MRAVGRVARTVVVYESSIFHTFFEFLKSHQSTVVTQRLWIAWRREALRREEAQHIRRQPVAELGPNVRRDPILPAFGANGHAVVAQDANVANLAFSGFDPRGQDTSHAKRELVGADPPVADFTAFRAAFSGGSTGLHAKLASGVVLRAKQGVFRVCVVFSGFKREHLAVFLRDLLHPVSQRAHRVFGGAVEHKAGQQNPAFQAGRCSKLDNVYNHENDFSKVFQFQVFYPEGENDYIWANDVYVAVEVHSGQGDVRGGYGPVRLYKADSLGDSGFFDWRLDWYVTDSGTGEPVDGYEEYEAGYSSNPTYRLEEDLQGAVSFIPEKKCFVGTYKDDSEVLLQPCYSGG